MNDLEKRIANLNLTWVWTEKAFTTVHRGYGFIIYYRNDRLWLAVLTPEVTKKQLEYHKTKPPEIIGSWISFHGLYTKRMFEILVSDALLVRVIESAFNQMWNEISIIGGDIDGEFE